jgi:hypothetical protein
MSKSELWKLVTQGQDFTCGEYQARPFTLNDWELIRDNSPVITRATAREVVEFLGR